MICMSVSATITIIDHLSQNFDAEVLRWSDTLKRNLKVGFCNGFFTLGLLWHGFHDSLKEGDGERIMQYWRFFLPVFKQQGYYNYSKETLNLIIQTKHPIT